MLPWFISVHNSSIQNPTINITCLEPDRSEEASELPTTKGGNQVPDTYNATSASTRLIPAQPTSTTSLVTGSEQYTESTQSQPDSKGTKCVHRKISCKKKKKYTETGFIILVIYAGSLKHYWIWKTNLICRFWLALWYLQTLLIYYIKYAIA